MILLLVTWALLASGFSGYTILALGRRSWRQAPPAPPPVLLVRPADDLAPREAALLAAPVAYGGALEHVVASPVPPLQAPALRWVASDPGTPNRKVGHLLAALDAVPARDRVVVVIDTDVRVEAELIEALAAAVVGGAALATAAPEPEAAPGFVARAVRALLCHTHLSFRALDAASIGAKAICGKAMALSPAAIDGVRALGGHVGEDLELACWLHRRLLPVVMVDVAARVPQEALGPLEPARDRFTRWMQVLRAHRPALWYLVPVFFTPSLPLLMLGGLLGGPVLGAALLVWAFRTGLAWRLAPCDAWWWPLGEALLLLAFLRSVGRRTVTWRGRRFRIARGGRMQPVPS